MSVSIIGLGYVGLSLSVLLSQKFKVFAVDVDPQKVDQVNNGVSPIVDTEISDFLTTKHLDLTATLDFDSAVSASDFVVIATPTDYDVATNSLTLQVRAVAARHTRSTRPTIMSSPPYYRFHRSAPAGARFSERLLLSGVSSGRPGAADNPYRHRSLSVVTTRHRTFAECWQAVLWVGLPGHSDGC